MHATFLKRWLRRVVPPKDEARSAERKARREHEIAPAHEMKKLARECVLHERAESVRP